MRVNKVMVLRDSRERLSGFFAGKRTFILALPGLECHYILIVIGKTGKPVVGSACVIFSGWLILINTFYIHYLQTDTI
jgi:hypothetical protein